MCGAKSLFGGKLGDQKPCVPHSSIPPAYIKEICWREALASLSALFAVRKRTRYFSGGPSVYYQKTRRRVILWDWRISPPNGGSNGDDLSDHVRAIFGGHGNLQSAGHASSPLRCRAGQFRRALLPASGRAAVASSARQEVGRAGDQGSAFPVSKRRRRAGRSRAHEARRIATTRYA